MNFTCDKLSSSTWVLLHSNLLLMTQDRIEIPLAHKSTRLRSKEVKTKTSKCVISTSNFCEQHSNVIYDWYKLIFIWVLWISANRTPIIITAFPFPLNASSTMAKQHLIGTACHVDGEHNKSLSAITSGIPSAYTNNSKHILIKN